MKDDLSITGRVPEKSNLIFSGVFVLVASNLLVKVIGLFFKIPMSYILEDEGMGYFNAAYTIYAWLYMISTAGVPVAVSILVSRALAEKNSDRVRSIVRTATILFVCVGIIGCTLLFLFARFLSRAIGATEAVYSMVAVSPTLLFVCVGSVLRGYYQGHSLMKPTAFSQLIEAFGKLMPGILLAYLAAKRGYPLSYVAGFAIFGVTVGSFFGMLFLLLIGSYYRKKGLIDEWHTKDKGTSQSVLRPLLKIIIPVTVSSSVMSLTALIDLAMIMRRLQSIGFTEAESAALYGNYTTLVIPVFNLPSVFIYPIACAMVPILTECIAKKRKEGAIEVTRLSLKVSSLLSLPCTFGIGTFSYPILSAVFRDSSAQLAAPYLTVLSPAIFFMCLLAVTNSILQTYGKQTMPIFSMLAGAVVKLAFGYLLIGNPRVAMLGAPLGTLLFYMVASLCNFFFVIRSTDTVLSVNEMLVLPLFASGTSVTLSALLYRQLSGRINGLLLLLVSISTAVLLYTIIVLLTGLISEKELTFLPGGKKLGWMFQKKFKCKRNRSKI